MARRRPAARQVVEPAADEVVEDANLAGPLVDQAIDDVRADQAGPSGDEDRGPLQRLAHQKVTPGFADTPGLSRGEEQIRTVRDLHNEGFAEGICVSVGTMNRRAVPRMNRHLPDLEVLAKPDRNSAGVHTLVLPLRDDHPDDVAGPEALLDLLPRSVPDREAILVRPAAVPLAVAARLDLERPDARGAEVLRVLAPTHAASSQCVLGKPARRAVPLRRPPEPVSTGRPVAWSRRNNSQRVALTAVASLSGLLALASGPSLEDRPGLGLQEDLDGPVALGRLHGSHARVRFETRSEPPRLLGDDVLDLERHVGLAAVAHVLPILLQQVLPHLVPGERRLAGTRCRRSRDSALSGGRTGPTPATAAVIGQSRRTEPTQVSTLATRLSRLGGSQPSRRVPVVEAGACGSRVLRTDGRGGAQPRSTSDALIARPRCSISTAATTRPVVFLHDRERP